MWLACSTTGSSSPACLHICNAQGTHTQLLSVSWPMETCPGHSGFWLQAYTELEDARWLLIFLWASSSDDSRGMLGCISRHFWLCWGHIHHGLIVAAYVSDWEELGRGNAEGKALQLQGSSHTPGHPSLQDAPSGKMWEQHIRKLRFLNLWVPAKLMRGVKIKREIKYLQLFE